MNVARIYYNMQQEMEVIQLRIDELEAQLKVSYRAVQFGDVPSDHGQIVKVPMDIAIDRCTPMVNELVELRAQLLEKQRNLKTVGDKLRKLDGVEYKVAVMKLMENKSLQQIADELGYSYGYVKNMSQKFRM